MQPRLLLAMMALGGAALQFGCSSKCSPQEPCIVTSSGDQTADCVASGTCGTTGETEQGELVFDCAGTQCKGAQLCVVSAVGCSAPGPSDGSARCVRRPSTCTDASTLCTCTMGKSTSGLPEPNPVCCYYAGWKPGTGAICNFGCD